MTTAVPIEALHQGARAVAVPGERGWEVEVSPGVGRLDVATGARLLGDLVAAVRSRGGGPLRWRVPAATSEHHRIARANGFDDRRRLVQLRRALPLPEATDLPTRPFRPDHDVDDWLRVNNAAFSWHPEQSAWTAADLHRQLDQPWFDPAGLLVHPVEGPLQGFCWTKVHRQLDPPMGEIFVIGVHPDHHGHGLGKALVLAGLDHLARQGLTRAMLYTEADNEPALGLYRGLGFTVHHQIVVFERQVDPEG